jgi:hypothetical protein
MKRNPEFLGVKICFTGIYFDKPELTLALDHKKSSQTPACELKLPE